MAEFTQAQIDGVAAACRENAEALAESLNLCFDRSYRLEPQEPVAWDAENVQPALDGPGLIVTLEVAGQAVLALIPASLPLPDWFTIPNDSEQSRLQTLAMEWSINMLPTDLPADDFRTFAATSLKDEVAAAGVVDSTRVLALRVRDKSAPAEAGTDEAGTEDPPNGEDGSDETGAEGPGSGKTVAGEHNAGETPAGDAAAEGPSEVPASAEPDGEGAAGDGNPEEQANGGGSADTDWPAAVYVVFPLAQAPVPAAEQPAATERPSDPPGHEAGPARRAVPRCAGRHDQQLRELPVTVSVRLAEKRIGLKQLLSLTPGALITFGKSCEELLDLYVNNHAYCRGEAVKIGEKFGLKINEIGQPPRREKRVL